MGKIVISENVSLDGVIQDPGGWFDRMGNKDREAWAKVEFEEALGTFGETSDQKPMRLVDNRTVGDDLVFLTYQPVRDAQLPLRRHRPASASSGPPPSTMRASPRAHGGGA
jgi:hypothetical protein